MDNQPPKTLSLREAKLVVAIRLLIDFCNEIESNDPEFASRMLGLIDLALRKAGPAVEECEGPYDLDLSIESSISSCGKMKDKEWLRYKAESSRMRAVPDAA